MNTRNARLGCAIAAGAAVATLANGGATAAEWTLGESASLTTSTEQNPTLRIGDTASSLLVSAAAGAKIEGRTDTDDLTITPNLRTYRYPSASQYDRTEERLALSFSDTRELISWTGTVNGARESTLTSELGTTGLTSVNLTKQTIDVSLGPTWQVTEKWSIAAAGDYLDSRYPGSGEPSSLFYNSNYATFTGTASYAISPLVRVSLNASEGVFRSDLPQPSSRSRNATVSLTYDATERWHATVLAGPSWVEAGNLTQQGFVYQATLSHAGQTSNLTFLADRIIAPTGQGVLTQRDDLQLTYTQQLSEKSSYALDLMGAHTTEAIPVFGVYIGDVKFLRAGVRVIRVLNRHWDLSAGVGDTLQRVSQASSTARGLNANISISWYGGRSVR